ncbi:MAG: AAA domain-containing protein [Zestosphaera sp.]
MSFTNEILSKLLSLLQEERKEVIKEVLRGPPIIARVIDFAHGIATVATREARFFEGGDPIGIVLRGSGGVHVREFGTVIDSYGDVLDVLVVEDEDLLGVVEASVRNGSSVRLCEYEPLISYDLQISLIECLESVDEPCRVNVHNEAAIDVMFGASRLGELRRVNVSDTRDVQVGFSLDESQIRAVESALALGDNELLLIVGPPGSGKTRVIAKIAHEFMKEGKRVLIASHTNRAVDNAVELLPIDRTLRVGRPEKVLPNIRPYLLSYKIREYLGERLKSTEESLNRLIETHKLLLYFLETAKLMRNTYEVRSLRRTISNLKKRMKELVKERAQLVKNAAEELSLKIPVVGSTLIKSQLYPLTDKTFDVVIIDEASQASLTLALLAMVKGRKWVVVGDHKQLPPIFKSVEDFSSLEGLSAFMSLIKKYPHRHLWLEINYRSHCEIVEFLSRYVYEGKIRPYIKCGEKVLRLEKNPSTDALKPEEPVVFVHVDSKSEWDKTLRSVYNTSEAKTVIQLVTELVSCGVDAHNIGVISPYRAQARLVKEELSKVGLSSVEASTVDAFQGREKDVIIFTVTTTGDLKFASEPHRLNVALSRARKKLIVVGNRRTIENNFTVTLIYHFLRYCHKLGRIYTA